MLDSPIFQAAQKHVEEQLAFIRNRVPIQDTEMHTRVILMGQLWNLLTGYFEQIAQTGQMVQIKLREEEQRRSLIERGIAMFRTSGRNSL